MIYQFNSTTVKYIFCGLFFLLANTTHAQDSIVIRGELINNTKYSIAVLEQFGIGSHSIYKAAINNGRFSILLPANKAPGIYRLRYSLAEQDRFVDIIINGEDSVSFTLDMFRNTNMPVFLNSDENISWYNYRQSLGDLEYLIYYLGNFIAGYPDKSDRITEDARKLRTDKIQAAVELRSNYIREHRDEISGKIVAEQPLYYPRPEDPYQLKAYNRWAGYWEHINCSDTELLNTPLYTEHIIQYMRYWIDPDIGFEEEEQNDGFIKSIDTVMKYFSANETMRNFAVRYLTLGFKELGAEKIVEYIDKNYRSEEQCETDIELQERLEAYNRLSTGKPAPKIYFTNSMGVEQEYFWSNKDADTLIVAFWASWCPHCVEGMPQLDSMLAVRKGIKAIAISLDDVGTEYMNAVSTLNNMQHYCDFKKWQSKPVEDYHIVATPSFFMVGKGGVIIDKYSSIRSLLRDIQ